MKQDIENIIKKNLPEKKDTSWEERYEKLRKNCAGHYDVSLPPEVKDFISKEIQKAREEGLKNSAHSIYQARQDLIKELKEKIEKETKKYHRTEFLCGDEAVRYGNIINLLNEYE